jgi:hypothetical protein
MTKSQATNMSHDVECLLLHSNFRPLSTSDFVLYMYKSGGQRPAHFRLLVLVSDSITY